MIFISYLERFLKSSLSFVKSKQITFVKSSLILEFNELQSNKKSKTGILYPFGTKYKVIMIKTICLNISIHLFTFFN